MLGLNTYSSRYSYNAGHPLNQGRVAWWIALPNNYGGLTWIDVVNGNQGVLTSFASPSGWSPASNVGGYGSMYFGGGPYVNLGATNYTNVAAVTVALWINAAATNNYGYVFSTNFTNLTIQAKSNGPPFQINVYWTNGGTNAITSVGTFGANVWVRVLVVANASGVKLYLNGKLDSSSAVAYSGNVNAVETWLGKLNNTQNPFVGNVNDVAIWNRVLSPAEIMQEYVLSQQGYPQVLRQQQWAGFNVPIVATPQFGWEESDSPILRRSRWENQQLIPWE